MQVAIVPCFWRLARVGALVRIDALENAESPRQVDKQKLSEAYICTKFIAPALIQPGCPLAEPHRIDARVEEVRQLCAQIRGRLAEARLADALVPEIG